MRRGWAQELLWQMHQPNSTIKDSGSMSKISSSFWSWHRPNSMKYWDWWTYRIEMWLKWNWTFKQTNWNQENRWQYWKTTMIGQYYSERKHWAGSRPPFTKVTIPQKKSSLIKSIWRRRWNFQCNNKWQGVEHWRNRLQAQIRRYWHPEENMREVEVNTETEVWCQQVPMDTTAQHPSITEWLSLEKRATITWNLTRRRRYSTCMINFPIQIFLRNKSK